MTRKKDISQAAKPTPKPIPATARKATPEPVAALPAPLSGMSRRGLVKHRVNPFMTAVDVATSTRVRRIAGATKGETMMIVAPSTGEIVGASGFWHTQEVDRTQFVKLYINGVKAFKELSGAGTKVFELLYRAVQTKIGADTVSLSFVDIDQALTPMASATFFRGTRELIEKDFIAETMVSGRYFVNPDFMWNGDRLAFVREYRVAKRGADLLTGDLFDRP